MYLLISQRKNNQRLSNFFSFFFFPRTEKATYVSGQLPAVCSRLLQAERVMLFIFHSVQTVLKAML